MDFSMTRMSNATKELLHRKFLTSAMADCELLRVSMVQLPTAVQQVELLAHAHDGAAGLPVQQGVLRLPEVVQVGQHVVT